MPRITVSTDEVNDSSTVPDRAYERSVGHGSEKRDAPHSTGAPSNPTDLSAGTWRQVLERTISEFRRNRCLDQSASLAFRSALALFPTLLVLVSLLGLLGETSRVLTFIVDTASAFGSAETGSNIRALFEALSQAPAGYAFATGLVLVLWSASGYVTAFGRALNSIFGVEEGRVAWRLRLSVVPLGALIGVLILLGVAAATIGGSLASAAGDTLDLQTVTVIAWNVVRFPVAALLAVLVIALLYYFSPNVKHPKLRWMSVGAGVALIVWAGASAGLLIYFSNFSSFDRTYGAIGGALVVLVWLWVTNWALLFGAQFDAELERARRRRSGLGAGMLVPRLKQSPKP